MITEVRIVEVHGREPHEVFALLADLENMPLFFPDSPALEVIGGAPVELGARLRVKGDGPRDQDDIISRIEITTFEPPRHFAMSGEAMSLVSEVSFELVETDHGTTARFQIAYFGRGLAKFIEWTARGQIRSTADLMAASFAEAMKVL